MPTRGSEVTRAETINRTLLWGALNYSLKVTQIGTKICLKICNLEIGVWNSCWFLAFHSRRNYYYLFIFLKIIETTNRKQFFVHSVLG